VIVLVADLVVLLVADLVTVIDFDFDFVGALAAPRYLAAKTTRRPAATRSSLLAEEGHDPAAPAVDAQRLLQVVAVHCVVVVGRD